MGGALHISGRDDDDLVCSLISFARWHVAVSAIDEGFVIDHLPLLVHGKSQFERLKTLPGFAVVVGLKRVGDDHQLLYDWLITMLHLGLFAK